MEYNLWIVIPSWTTLNHIYIYIYMVKGSLEIRVMLRDICTILLT
jgi:hypothetical protein